MCQTTNQMRKPMMMLMIWFIARLIFQCTDPPIKWLNYAKPSPPIRNNATEHAALDVTHDNENMEEQQQNI